ncbi:MAG: MAPEG family protein [Shewanella sp.]
MFSAYTWAFWGIVVLIATLLVQALVAAFSKASQPGAIPGKIDASLSHASFVFRSNRTFANSLENITPMLGCALLAIFVGANAAATAALIWVMALARLVHMWLYYVIATEKNPSPRSYFYLLAMLANIALLLLCVITLAIQSMV